MSIKDVIKSSIYNRLGGGTGLQFHEILIILIIACLVGTYLYFLYKSTSKAAFYSKDLAITLAGMPVVIAAIMIAMQSNLLVSLGMVGALSIVRFRTAIKNPLDLLYLFWSISAGIICGVGLYALAIGLSIVMTILVLGLSVLPGSKANSVLILSTTKETDWKEIDNILKDNCKYYKEKSRNIKNGITEVIYEVFEKNDSTLPSALEQTNQFDMINILSHDGELRM